MTLGGGGGRAIDGSSHFRHFFLLGTGGGGGCRTVHRTTWSLFCRMVSGCLCGGHSGAWCWSEQGRDVSTWRTRALPWTSSSLPGAVIADQLFCQHQTELLLIQFGRQTSARLGHSSQTRRRRSRRRTCSSSYISAGRGRYLAVGR